MYKYDPRNISSEVAQLAFLLRHCGLDAAQATPVPLALTTSLQVAAIAAPVATVLGTFLLSGVENLYMSIPVGLGLFMLMDATINTLRARFASEDNDRTVFIHALADKLNVPVESITKNDILELAEIYDERVKSIADQKSAEARAHEAFVAAVVADTKRMKDERLKGLPVRVNRNILPSGINHWLEQRHAKSFTKGSMASFADSDGVIPDAIAAPDFGSNVNGMPMVAPGTYDVSGRTYGQF